MTSCVQKMNTVNFSALQNWSILSHLTATQYRSKYELVKIGSFLKRIKDGVEIQDDVLYKRATIKINNGGVFLRDTVVGNDIGTKNQYIIREGQLLLSKIDARNGAFGIVPKELDGGVITGNFWVYEIDTTKILPQILCNILSSQKFQTIWETCSNGTTNRHYLQEDAFLNTLIPVPDIKEQHKILSKYEEIIWLKNNKKIEIFEKQRAVEDYLINSLKISAKIKNTRNTFISFTKFESITCWGVDKISHGVYQFYDFNQQPISLIEYKDWLIDVFRGKSPIYQKDSDYIILNQKCNRWNYIDDQYAKTVDGKWYRSLDKDVFLKENDIIVNSTGEGTLGRASLVTSKHIGYLVDSHMLVLRLNTECLSPEFIVRQINSEFGQKQVDLLKGAQATKQTELGVDNLLKMKFVIPIDSNGNPDLIAQNNIVSEIKKIEMQIQELSSQVELLEIQAKQQFEDAIFG